jgi:AcrR family transcriptional regulator
MSPATHNKRRQQILDVAARHFSKHGYAGTSMRSLAQDVGVSAPALYRHFPSKLALFEAVIGERQNGHDTRAELMPLRDKRNIGEVLRAVSVHLLESAQQRPEVLRLLLFTSLTEDPAAAKLLEEFRAPYVEFLSNEFTRRIEQGAIAKVNPGITARCYVAMVMGCALNSQIWNSLEGVSYEMLEIVDNNVPIFARGLAVPSSDGDLVDAHSLHPTRH